MGDLSIVPFDAFCYQRLKALIISCSVKCFWHEKQPYVARVKIMYVTEVAKLCLTMKKNTEDIKRWYAVYTKPRWEKKVNKLLEQNGVETYCPLNKVHKKWSDRNKVIDEPLFKSYVFVKVADKDKTNVRLINGVMNFVYWLGKPAVIREDDIVRIKKFLNDYESVSVEGIKNAKPGDRVIISSGIFMDHEGIVLEAGKKKIEIQFDYLGCRLVAFVDKDRVIKVSKKTGSNVK